jgi:hypothetical protein
MRCAEMSHERDGVSDEHERGDGAVDSALLLRLPASIDRRCRQHKAGSPHAPAVDAKAVERTWWIAFAAHEKNEKTSRQRPQDGIQRKLVQLTFLLLDKVN